MNNRTIHIVVVICGIILIAMVCVMTSCNYQYIDTTWDYDYAYVKLQNGEVVEGPVSYWRDYEDGDQIQVKINDNTYLVHASNCTLIDRGN